MRFNMTALLNRHHIIYSLGGQNAFNDVEA